MVVRDLQPDDPLAVKCREENSGQLLQDPTLLSPVSRRHVVFECRGEPTHRVADTVNYFVHYGCRDCKAAAVKETLADTHPHIAAMVVRDLQPDDPLAVQCRVENKGQLFQDPTRITKGSSRRVVFECRGEPTHRFVDTVNLFVNRGCKLCNALARERGAMAKARKSEVLPIESGAASKEGSRRKSEPVGRSKRKLDDLELEESGAESAAAKRPLKESTGSSRLLHGQHQTQDDRVILGSQDRLDGVRASAPSAASLDDEVTPIMDSVDGSTDSDREDGLSGILRRLNQLERENDQLRKDVARLTQEHEALEAKQTASWNDLNTWKGMISRELHKARDGNQGDRERAVGFFNEVGRFLNEGRDYLRQYEEEEREDSFESMVERERLKTAPVSSALAKLLGQPRPSGSA
ncbi:hypothetical protein DFJ74DRAFT_697623 [Hyaloraphidium curvatum]|nr:hypothetical protein DFJ74DRAFT_697623 [Hyaloraphidium curvatum]